MAGCLIAALIYVPIFKAITKYANPVLADTRQSSPLKNQSP